MPNIGDILREAAYDSQLANYRSGGNRLNAWGGVVNALGGFMTDMAGYFERKRQYEEGKEFEREQFEWKKGVTSRQEAREERAEGRAAERHGPEMELLKTDRDYRKSLLTKLEGELEDIEADKAVKKKIWDLATGIEPKELRDINKLSAHLVKWTETLPESERHMAGAAMREMTQSLQIFAPANIQTNPDYQTQLKWLSTQAAVLRSNIATEPDPNRRSRMQAQLSDVEEQTFAILGGKDAQADLEARKEDSDEALLEWARMTAKNASIMPTEVAGSDAIMRFLTDEHEGFDEPIIGGKKRGEDISGYGNVLKQWVVNELRSGRQDAVYAMRYLDKDGKINIRKVDEGLTVQSMLKRAQLLEQLYPDNPEMVMEGVAEYGTFAGWTPSPTGEKSQIIRKGLQGAYQEPSYSTGFIPQQGWGPPQRNMVTPPPVTMSPSDAARLALKQTILSAQGQQLKEKPKYSDTLKENVLTVDEWIKVLHAMKNPPPKPAGQ